jgi:hypothetical protein
MKAIGSDDAGMERVETRGSMRWAIRHIALNRNNRKIWGCISLRVTADPHKDCDKRFR